MVCAGIRSVLCRTSDLDVAAEAKTQEEALEMYVRLRPDVVCLDLVLGDFDGLQLVKLLKAQDPTVRILVVSVRDETAYAERCLQAGALGYVMKSQSNEVMVTGLREVAEGKVFVSARMEMLFLRRTQQPKDSKTGVSSLSSRELEVFQLIGLGLSSRSIAKRLGIGSKTVETHRDNIRTKLRLPHSSALVREAVLWVKSNINS